LIGQPFSAASYFWSRPSATVKIPYDASASNASNLGPSNPALREAVASRIGALKAADPDNATPIPVDLVTASGSGLDPHLSPAGAFYQVKRIARERNVPEADVRRLVEEHIEGRFLGILGEPRVNVLLLNLALDGLVRERLKD
jgi:K+-transporting ATPase ATPase C chain